MPPRNTPSIFPYLAASFIEAGEKGSTIEAIRFITQEELKGLKDAHKKAAELRKIVEEAKKREAQIFSLLKNLNEAGGDLTYTLSQDTKRLMYPLFHDLLFLYEHRMGMVEARKLRALFLSKNDEPYDFILEYEMEESTKKFYIKSLGLVSHLSENEERAGEYPVGTIFRV